MSKKKHVLGTIVDVLAVVLALGGVVLHWCAYNFMTINRIVKMLFNDLSASVPMDAAFVGMLVVPAVVAVLALVALLRSHTGGGRRVVRLVVVVALACLAAAFTITAAQVPANRPSYMPMPTAYYARVFTLPLLDLGALVAGLRAIFVFSRKQEAEAAHHFAKAADTKPAPQQHKSDPNMRIDLNNVDEEADAARMRQTHRVTRIVTVAVIAAIVAVCALVPTVRNTIATIFSLLSSGNTDAVVELIRSYGPWAAAVSCLLMVLQSLAAPIPAFLITFANAAVFGWWQGAILSWASAMLGAAICFAIARILGRDAVAHFATHGVLETIDRFFQRFGSNAILVCRLLPFMSFDAVSYAAGLTGMGFWSFFWATGLGQLPATIVYSYVGGMLTGSTKTVITALMLIFALFALVYLLRRIWVSRHADLNPDGADSNEE